MGLTWPDAFAVVGCALLFFVFIATMAGEMPWQKRK